MLGLMRWFELAYILVDGQRRVKHLGTACAVIFHSPLRLQSRLNILKAGS